MDIVQEIKKIISNVFTCVQKIKLHTCFQSLFKLPVPQVHQVNTSYVYPMLTQTLSVIVYAAQAEIFASQMQLPLHFANAFFIKWMLITELLITRLPYYI